MTDLSSSPNTIARYWDDLYSTDKTYSRQLNGGAGDAVVAADRYFGDIRGKTLIDIGCGAGTTSLHFAQRGANVIAVDVSEVAIATLKERCRALGVTNVTPVVCDAMSIDKLGPCDFVYGAMILHHLEPFEAFCATLKRTLKPGARAFFWENNSASDLLVWVRTHIVGKLWIPKYGDPDEFPLTPAEVNTLRKHFDVTVAHAQMYFFGLIPVYVLGGRFKKPFDAIDAWLFRKRIGLKYSYEQHLLIRDPR